MKLQNKENHINSNDNRGFLLPNDRALQLMRKYFVQSCIAQGRVGKFYQVRKYTTKGTDHFYEYEAPVDVAYHIDPHPSRKFLTKYGWFTDEQSNLPIILFLTFYDINNKPINIDEGALIELSGKRTIGEGDIQTELFEITDVETDLELNQCVCKIVPERLEQKENVKVLADKKDPNLENVYLNRQIYYDEGGSTDEDNQFISRT